MNIPDKIIKIAEYRADILKHIASWEEPPEAMVLITALLSVVDIVCKECNLNIQEILTAYTQISDNYMSVTDTESEYLQ